MTKTMRSKLKDQNTKLPRLAIHDDPAPIRIDAGGAVRVGPTRVTLTTVIGSYLDGDTPAKIVDQFPTLQLADVYSVIGYYLRHRDEVDAFLKWEEAEGERLRKEIEAYQDPTGEVRAGLKARLAAQRS